MLKRAGERLKSYPSEPAKTKNYLKSWLEELLGDFWFARASSTSDVKQAGFFYATAEKYYNQAIKDRLNLKNLRIAGIVQCSLAQVEIKRGHFDEAEKYNNEGMKNILTFTDKIYTVAKCLRNDALIKFGKDQVDNAKEVYKQALELLEEVLPEGNDLSRSFKGEFQEMFVKGDI